MLTTLHWFQCRNCKGYATSPVHIEGERHMVCNLCHQYMRHLFDRPIRTADELALAERGVVYHHPAAVTR